jgi:TPR repeat protein
MAAGGTAIVGSGLIGANVAPTSHAAAIAPERSALAPGATLLARGETFLAAGDVTSARPYFERAAAMGNGGAALRLGKTFDPAFLHGSRFVWVRGDPAVAASWYRQARALGNRDARLLLEKIGDIGR